MTISRATLVTPGEPRLLVPWLSVTGASRFFELALLFTLHRIAFLWIIVWGAIADPKPAGPTPATAAGLLSSLSSVSDRLCVWDCGWYASIASEGYATREHAAFFPLFPLAGRFVTYLTAMDVRLSLVLVANLAAFVALLAASDFVQTVSDERTSRWFAALWILWPFSMFQAVGYAESLMIAGVAVALAFAARGYWWASACGLAVAVMTRHIAVLSGVALVALYVRAVERPRLRDVCSLLVPGAALGAHMLFLERKFGDPILFFNIRDSVSGWSPASVFDYFAGKMLPCEVPFMLASSIPLMVGAIFLWKRRAFHPAALWATLHVLVVAKVGVTGTGRFLAECFVLLIPLAFWAARHREHGLLMMAAFGLIQGMCLHLYSHHFWLA